MNTFIRSTLAAAAAGALVLGSVVGAVASPGTTLESPTASLTAVSVVGKSALNVFDIVDDANGVSLRDVTLRATVRDEASTSVEPDEVTISLDAFSKKVAGAELDGFEPITVTLLRKNTGPEVDKRYEATYVFTPEEAAALAAVEDANPEAYLCISDADAVGYEAETQSNQTRKRLGKQGVAVRDCVKIINVDPTIPGDVDPAVLDVPASVSGTGYPITYDVRFGYSGSFSAEARGLVAPVVDEGTVGRDRDETFGGCGDSEGVAPVPVIIPAGSTYARFALFDSDVTPGTDLDLYVCQGPQLLGVSAAGTSDEEANFAFSNPTGSDIPLTAYVHSGGIAGGDTSPFALYSWGIPATANGTMAAVAPASATLGASATIDLIFTGLDPATRYLGSVADGGAAQMPSPTIVQVSTP